MPSVILEKFKWQISFLLLGLSFISAGILLTSGIFQKSDNLEIITDEQLPVTSSDSIVIDITGEVNSPGVYDLPPGSRVADALEKAGGVTKDANLDWIAKNLNRASPLKDGQKLFIPSQSQVLSANNLTTSYSSDNSGSGSININSASQKELESLSGIGPVFAQNIIEGRPYSSVEELLSKKIIRSDIYEKNKDKLSVY